MSRPVRLLMTTDAVGGVWQYALDLAAALTPLGFETILALLGPAAGPERQAEVAALPGVRLIGTGLPLDWLAQDEGAVRNASRALAELARIDGADLLQINHPALAAEAMPVPVVAALHSCVATWWAAAGAGPLPATFVWQTALVRAGLTGADAVVCPSAAFAEQVRSAYALPLPPQVVHNGRRQVATVAASPQAFAFTAGRLWDAGKNVATLDRVAALLPAPFRAAGAVERPTGERIALDHLQTLGTLGDAEVADLLARKPVFASAALYEPFGLAVLEAALAGCPLVLADIATFRELWSGAATFVGAHDVRGFADAIGPLLADPARHAAHGAAARRRAELFTPAAMATGMAGIYTAALERRVAA